MNSNDSLGFTRMIILILITVGIPIALLVGFQKTINYQVNGTEVSATVTDVQTLLIRGKYRTNITVAYENESGELVTAQATNAVSPVIGQTITGKVLAGNPDELFLDPPVWQLILVYSVAGLCFIGGLVIIFALIRGRKTDKQMASQSMFAEATVVGRENVGGYLFLDVQFRDGDGIIRKASCRAPEYWDPSGSTCHVRYIAKSEKKVVCEIV